MPVSHLPLHHEKELRKLPCIRILSIIKRIKANDIEFIVHEPVIKEAEFFHSKIVNEWVQFKQQADVNVANHVTDDVAEKITAVINLEGIRKLCCP